MAVLQASCGLQALASKPGAKDAADGFTESEMPLHVWPADVLPRKQVSAWSLKLNCQAVCSFIFVNEAL